MAVLHPNPSALEALGVVPTPKSPIRLRPKEIANASEDGFTVVVRPRPEGGFHVLTVDVGTQTQIGWPLIAESRSDVPAAITELMRNMNKFMNLGGDMAQAGRHRDKRHRRLASLRAELRRVEASLSWELVRLDDDLVIFKVPFDFSRGSDSLKKLLRLTKLLKESGSPQELSKSWSDSLVGIAQVVHGDLQEIDRNFEETKSRFERAMGLDDRIKWSSKRLTIYSDWEATEIARRPSSVPLPLWQGRLRENGLR